MMVQWLSPHWRAIESRLLPFPTSSLLMRLGSQWKMAQVLGPCHPRGDQAGVPGSWLWFGPAPGVAAIWG